MNKIQAEQLLKDALANPLARFREGQWEAIDALVNRNQKLLVVQRTGWGKSSVYFISTRILRDRGLGPVIIISPLLALMRNQIASAERLGLTAKTMNSTNTDEWKLVTAQIMKGEVDCLLISPERLANDNFVATVLQPIADRIALMVVDEAHCISDWGHDFRPDYRRIVNILKQLPANTPVLGTTATANNRVVDDIQSQFGDIEIQRGSLVRESLALQVLSLPDQASRLAWLATYIPELPGTGIIYTLTTRDAEQVSDWLNENGIVAKAYHGSIVDPAFPDSNHYRQHLEDLLLNNEVKVLVATMALGMGYDKPDLGFVVHYQAPGSIVAYYQQVGRAGRGIDYAVGVLMLGAEDDDIHDYFRSNAFPSVEQITEILGALSASDGLTLRQLEEITNLRNRQIKHVLKFLSVDNPATVIKDGSQWRRTAVPFAMDHQRVEHLTQQREQEWEEVQGYLSTSQCLMNFLRSALDDEQGEPCGKCANCLGRSIVSLQLQPELIHQGATFIKHAETVIEPKRQFATGAFNVYHFRGNIPLELRAEQGRVLSRWNDAGWGKMVADDKHNNHFRDELIVATAEMIQKRWHPEDFPTWICCVPSLNHIDLVPSFARRLAVALGIPFVDVIGKIKPTEPQKAQKNRYHQCSNLDGAFGISNDFLSGSVLLVDDIIGSGWTLTVLAALLQQVGSGKVYPVALASSAIKE